MPQDKETPVLDDERLPEDMTAPVADETDAKSLSSEVSGLIEDVRVLAHAEVEYYRTKLTVNMAATKRLLTLFAVAIIFGTMAIIALILGALLVLSDYFGPLAATGIVTGSALLIATVMMGMAIKRARKLPLDENDA
ncbi:phage holin family protein [Parasphingorhabdus sp.]|uniref:phage holin family protein n=1 Tax=Parasphingorhabdus sp. TaxID=2709688 RepID=UPI003264B87B